MHRATYKVSTMERGLDIGASYGRTSDDPAGIVARATEAAKTSKDASGQWDGYGLLTKNSETFAYWLVLHWQASCVTVGGDKTEQAPHI